MPRKKKTAAVRVMFRRSSDGEVTAVFPDMKRGQMVACYASQGQHSECDVGWIKSTKPASTKQAAALKRELTRIGYNIRLAPRARLK